MIVEKLNIQNEQSVQTAYSTFFGHEKSSVMAIKKRPVIVICPGGGYDHTSDRESEIVAMQFLAMGYHSAVVRYSCAPARYPAALLELAKAVKEIRDNKDEWAVDENKIFIMGFSAGGHLAANYCAFWENPFLSEKLGCDTETLRPNGQILCYPVITSGEFGHQGSFKSLLGEEYESRKEEFSLEKQVNSSIPRTFVWHTFEDQTVPVQNSLLYVNELVAHKIPVEYHVFEKGSHGSSLGSLLSAMADGSKVEPVIEPWISLLHTWIGKF